MAKRRPIPPFLTLPESAVVMEPTSGWELIVGDQQPVLVADRSAFPSWDSTLRFELRRRFHVDVASMLTALELGDVTCRISMVTRMETGRGLVSEMINDHELDLLEPLFEVIVKPDSMKLSQDLTLICAVALANVEGNPGELSPTTRGARLWQDRWSVKLEGGRTRLPIEVISFSKNLQGYATPNALYQVAVADYPELEFEQAVCVYLNADYPKFVAAVERGEPAVTAMLWDAVVRQLVSFGASSAFADHDSEWPDGSVGAHLRSWMSAMFPGERPSSIFASRIENPGLFEARIQSWAKAGSFWGEGAGS